MPDKLKKIFIIDDDKFLREMYVNKFINAGFEVESAGSAKEAIDKFAEGYSPDVVLFDIIMPIETGWDLMRQLKESKYIPNAKKIVLSNQGEENDIKMAQEFQVDGYIVKALSTPGEVVAQVQEISKK